MFTALLTSIQWITGQNLYSSIAVLTIILGLTLFFATQEFKSNEGPVAGTIFLLFTFFYARILLGKTLSEFTGLPFGLLALVFLLRGVITKQLKYILIGLIVLSLALNARAGAFIVLPMIAFWTGWYFRKTSFFHWKSFLLACVAITSGFVINMATFKEYSSSLSAPFGNFSHTIYGLARGGLGWTQIYTDHPESWDMQSDKQAQYIYSLTLDLIKRKPMNLVNGIISSYKTFFSLDDYYGSIGWFGGSGTIGNISRITFYLLLLAGLVFCIKDFKKPLRSFFLFTFIGIFLSIPFAPPIDSNRMRVYAATIPFFVAIPSFGLAALCNYIPWKYLKPRDSQQQSMAPALGLGIVLFLFMTIVPIIPFKLTPAGVPPEMICAEGLKAVSFRILPGNHIRIVDQETLTQDWVPLIRQKTFATRIHNLPNWRHIPLFPGVKPGQVILVDLVLKKNEPMILIADWDKTGNRSGIQTVCGRPSDDIMLREYNVFFAEEYLPE